MPMRANIDDYVTANGTARTPLTPEEQAKDDLGFTNPNLHRRIDVQPPTDPSQVGLTQYTLGVYDKLNSYRITRKEYHDEESTTCEIP